MRFRRKSAKQPDFEHMTEEEIQAPVNRFKNRTLPIIVSVIGVAAALLYVLWVLGVFSR